MGTQVGPGVRAVAGGDLAGMVAPQVVQVVMEARRVVHAAVH